MINVETVAKERNLIYGKKNVCKIHFLKSFLSPNYAPPVPNLGIWIIYPGSTKNSYRILKITNTKEEGNSVYPWQGPQSKFSSIAAQNVYDHLKYFAHCIHFYPLWPSEKRPVEYTQSASCSYFVESSSKGAARSVSESDGVSEGVGSLQTLL